MSIDGLPVRWAIMVGLLAIVPALWYGFGRAGSAGVITVINVLIIVAALYVATGPVSVGPHHADEGHGH
ncbi:cytochrome-ba3 oxidase subunit [Natrialbaceae archaeon A-CW2]|uniref:cytochrome-ba3 oxidase subunit n=1 Tax=Natronosalvus amylolyticus TaxID=2961994 RepID=UPI0020C95AF1|nr:cytochrome-ba3 oxidase subunit [Natronosalvus amylolyticus]